VFPPSRTLPAGSSTIGADTVSMVRVRGVLLCAALLAVRASADSLSYGPSSFAPPGAFPTQLYASYYNDPTATSAQPQPVISDPVLVRAHCGIYRRSALMTSYIFFCRTRYIPPGSPTRRTYLRCVSSSCSVLIVRFCHR
jgi:hypothetical protein